MDKMYLTPSIELIDVSTEDIISTSPTIELPFFPTVDDDAEA